MTEEELQAAKKRFTLVYSGIFGEISSMLSKAKLMPLTKLMEHNPSFTEMVDQLQEYRCIVELINKGMGGIFDVGMVDTYIEKAKALAISIDKEDHEGLGAAIAALDELPYV